MSLHNHDATHNSKVKLMIIFASIWQVISANQQGEMKLQVETDLATVATHFRDLEKPTWSK